MLGAGRAQARTVTSIRLRSIALLGSVFILLIWWVHKYPESDKPNTDDRDGDGANLYPTPSIWLGEAAHEKEENHERSGAQEARGTKNDSEYTQCGVHLGILWAGGFLFGASRISADLVRFCLTSKMSETGKWRGACVSMIRDIYPASLHRVVRPDFLTEDHTHAGLWVFLITYLGQGS